MTQGEERSLTADEDNKEEADHAEIMQSLLGGLDKAFTEALVADSMPYIKSVAA